MDGQRFDDLTRTLAAGTSRRRVLRVVGGGLAAALLGVLGRSDQAAAELVFSSCLSYDETGGPPVLTGDPGDQRRSAMPVHRGVVPGAHDRVGA